MPAPLTEEVERVMNHLPARRLFLRLSFPRYFLKPGRPRAGEIT